MLKRVLLICLLGAAMSVYAMGRVDKESANLIMKLDTIRGNTAADSLSSDSGWIPLMGNVKDYSSFAIRIKFNTRQTGAYGEAKTYTDTFYSAGGGAGIKVYLVLYSSIGDTLYKLDSLATALTSLPKTYYKTISRLIGDTAVHKDLMMKYVITDTTSCITPVLDSIRLHPTTARPRRTYPISYEVISKE